MLCALRSLGRRGVEVHTTQTRTGSTICSLSRFCRAAHVLPHYEQAAEFDHAFLQLLEQERFDYVLPASDAVMKRLSEQRDAVAQLTRVDLPPAASLELTLCKTGLLTFAQNAGVPTPLTLPYDGAMPARDIAAALGYPMVAKSADGETYNRILYINSDAQLERCIARHHRDRTLHFQEYVDGPGCGYFALFENGAPVLTQMHKRLWEYPVTGGPSVFARTFDDRPLRDLGTRLLTALEWNGLAMVEFKKSARDGQYKLLEVNPRLWGSLDLSVAAGADFPWLAVNRDRAALLPWMRVRDAACFWPMPDGLLYLAARPSKLIDFCSVLFSPQVRTNICVDDPLPLVRQFREALYWMKELAVRGRFRYPHRKPETADFADTAGSPARKAA